MHDNFQFNRSNSSSFIKKNKKQNTIFHLPKLSNKYKKKNFDYKKLTFSTYQYLVGYPFIWMTPFNRFGAESTNFFVTSVPIPYQTRSKDCFSSVSFFGFSFFILLSTSSHICSMGFKSGENGGHLSSLTSFSFNQCVTIWVRCFGSLSCCMTHSLSGFNFFIDSNKFFCKISRYTSPVMLPSIKTRFPTTHDEKQPQHFTFLPPYFTVGTVHFGSSSSFGVRHTITLPSDPDRLNLLSSVHNTLSHILDACLDWPY